MPVSFKQVPKNSVYEIAFYSAHLVAYAGVIHPIRRLLGITVEFSVQASVCGTVYEVVAITVQNPVGDIAYEKTF